MLLVVGRFFFFFLQQTGRKLQNSHSVCGGKGQSGVRSRRPLAAQHLLLLLRFSTVSEAAGTVPPIPLWDGPKWQHRAEHTE